MADFVSLNGYNVKDVNAGKALSISGNTLSLDKADGTSLDTVTLPDGVEVITVTHSSIPITYGGGTVSSVSSTKTGATYTKGSHLRTAFANGAIIVFTDGTYKEVINAVSGTQFTGGTPSISVNCSIADNANIVGSTVYWGDRDRIIFGDLNGDFPTANTSYDLINSNGGFASSPDQKVMIGDIIEVRDLSLNYRPEASGIVTGFDSNSNGYSMITQKYSDNSYCVVEFTIDYSGAMTVNSVTALGGGGSNPIDIEISDISQMIMGGGPMMPINVVTGTDIAGASAEGRPIRIVQMSGTSVIFYITLHSGNLLSAGTNEIAFLGEWIAYNNGSYTRYPRAFIASIDPFTGNVGTVQAVQVSSM